MYSPSRTQHGLSLIEMLLALVVVALLGTLSYTALKEFRGVQVLSGAAEVVASTLDEARTKTLASENASRYGVHFETDRIVLFAGTVYNASDPDNDSIDIPTPAYLKTIPPAPVVFRRLTGAVDTQTDIVVGLSGEANERTVRVEQTGLVSIID